MQKIAAEIITIGAEVLKGTVVNTNARFLGKELTDLGFDVVSQVSCPDSVFSISRKLKEALLRSELVILTGGLGPTPDDVTREGVAAYFKVPLVLSKTQYDQIKKHYKRHFRSVPAIVKKEAQYPKNALPLINRFGIALGFYVKQGKRLAVVLPGVPSELQKMYQSLVKPLIKKNFKDAGNTYRLVVKMTGISEPDVMKRLGKGFFDDTFEFGIYPAAGEVSIRIYAESNAIIERLKVKVKTALKKHIYATYDASLATVLGDLLVQKKQTLSIAESCTGGLMSAEFTKIPGASRYFMGGVTAYANRVKEETLGVSKKILDKSGAVSKEVAVEMARGVKKKLNSTYGIGITGIAGPKGGTRQKPVGLVYLALSGPKTDKVWDHRFWGNRYQVQHKAVKKALEYLWRELEKT